MLIVCSKEGQLCNRLFHFSHLASFAIEQNEILWYPFIKEYSNFFPNIQKLSINNSKIYIYSNPIILFILRIIKSILKRIPSKIFLCNDTNIEIDLSNYSVNEHRLLLISGWLFRDKKSLIKNKDFIKHLFAFDNEIIINGNQIINNLKADNKIIIGLHIRRGDYAYFENGKYFYNAEIYSGMIQQVRDIDLNNQKFHFVIITNDKEIFLNKALNAHDVTHINGNEALDLYCLSKCDYIIGPPSTFSAWASFYGSVPIQFIESDKYVINFDNFKIIEY